MKTAVIYARYSSDNQTEQSIEGQLRVCSEYAKRNDIIIVGAYIDRAMTGTNDLRPDFQKMLKDSNKKQWDYVLVYKLDRFSRNKYETTIHKHTLLNNGIKVLSAMENIPDSPEGIILESLLEGMNQYYSEELAQKVNRGLKESYLKGNYTGGVIVYGYNVVDKKCVINEQEAIIVREIFTKFSQGITGVDIVKNLRERGIRNKNGVYFTDKMIYRMLANTKYIGEITHKDVLYTNIYPAIISKKTWNNVQSIRNSFQHSHCRKKDIYNYILSGKLICGYCGHKLLGESGKEINGVIQYRYYNCLTKRRLHKACDFKSTNKHSLEDDVFNTTWKVLSNNNLLQFIAKEILKKHQILSNDNSNIKSLESQKNACLKSSNNLISAIEQGIITEQTKSRLKELEKQIAQLEFDIDQEKQRDYTFLTEDLIIDYFKNTISGDISNVEVQKIIIKTFIREIIVYNDKLIIAYNFTEPILTSEHTLDKLHNIMDNLNNSKLISLNQIEQNIDLKFFSDKQYFAIINKRQKNKV